MALRAKAMITIEPKITGANTVESMFKDAPVRFLITARKWLYAERNRYLGSSKRDGKFRAQIKKLKLGDGAPSPFNRSGKWGESLARSFKGYVLDKNNPDRIRLRLGTGLRNPSEFLQGIAMMEESATNRRIASTRFMTIPAYRNLKRFGLGIKGNADDVFNKAKEQGINMVPVRAGNGSILWFDESKRKRRATKSGAAGAFPKSALLFVGKKGVKLSQKFNFIKQFYDQKPFMVKRFEARINRAIRDMKMGYVGKKGNIKTGEGTWQTVS